MMAVMAGKEWTSSILTTNGNECADQIGSTELGEPESVAKGREEPR